LAFAGKKERDPFFGTIPDAKIFLAQSLLKLSTAHPGTVGCNLNYIILPFDWLIMLKIIP